MQMAAGAAMVRTLATIFCGLFLAADCLSAVQEPKSKENAKTRPKPGASHSLIAASSEVTQSLSSQASMMEQTVFQAQMASEAKLSRQKALFDAKVKRQESSNVNLVFENRKISSQVNTLKKANAALSKKAKTLRSTTHVMEMELSLLNRKLDSAGDFAKQAAAVAPSFLEVGDLVEAKYPSAMDASSVVLGNAFAGAMGDLVGAPDDAPVNGKGQTKVDPDVLLEDLSSTVEHMKMQKKQNEDSLKQQFIKDFKKGSKRHAALLSEQKQLVTTRRFLERQHIALKRECVQLEKRRKGLQHDLHNLGHYLKDLATLAEAPASKVPRMLRSIPKNVEASVY